MTALGEALRAIHGDEVPRAFALVDDAMSAEAPDLVEHSIAFDPAGLRPWRATYYLDADVAPRGDAAGRRLAELAEALGIEPPPALLEPLESASVLQHVIGVDAGPPLRLKRYVIFRRGDRSYVEDLLRRLDRTTDLIERGRVYILGFDLGAGGLRDVKLYFDLELSKVGPFLRGRSELLTLLEGSRQVVLGQRLGGGQTMYFHADGHRVLAADLHRRATAHPSAAEVQRRLAALDARHPMAPWIAGVPYGEDGPRSDALTLYLHPR